MVIHNLHQPYLFKNNNKINLIVSEFMNKSYELVYGGQTIYEDYWKLHHLDENHNKTIIKTPEFITYENNYYRVIAECNGFVNNNKLSYIVGIHNGQQNASLNYFLIESDYDKINNETYNHKIITRTRTGFIKNNDVYSINYTDNSVTKNYNYILNYNNYVDQIIRLINVYDTNLFLFTGEKNGKFKTYVYDIENNAVKILKNINNSDLIYKSSIIGNENDGIIAYTEKVFMGESEIDYLLHIEYGYKLENYANNIY